MYRSWRCRWKGIVLCGWAIDDNGRGLVKVRWDNGVTSWMPESRLEDISDDDDDDDEFVVEVR